MPQSPPNPFGDLPYQPAAQEELVKAELVPEDPKDRGERISILYLMVWTACTAVILALYRHAMTLTDSTETATWLQALTGLVGAPIQGACVASLLLVLWRRFKGGRPFPKQPGHWLLVIPGITSLAGWSLSLALRPFIQGGFYTYYILFQRLPLLVLFSVLAVYAITKLRAEPRWRIMFVVWFAANFVVMLISCVGSFGRGTSIIESVIGVAIMLGFLIPTLLDLKDGRRRDHLHYAGIAARIGNAGMTVIQVLRIFFAQ